jgi:hypothetical protein
MRVRQVLSVNEALDASNTVMPARSGCDDDAGRIFLGVGSMVGASIFASSRAKTVAGAAVWLSFLIAGIVAALRGPIKLGAQYPS